MALRKHSTPYELNGWPPIDNIGLVVILIIVYVLNENLSSKDVSYIDSSIIAFITSSMIYISIERFLSVLETEGTLDLM